MAKKPTSRYQTALEMGKVLARIEETHRPPLTMARGKSTTKRDPARATTELPTASAAATVRKDKRAKRESDAHERTSVISGAASAERSSGGGATRVFVALLAIGALAAMGWYVWQRRQADDAAATRPKPAHPSTVATASADAAVAPPLPEAAITAVADAAVAVDAAVDAGVATIDASAAAAIVDAGVGAPQDAGAIEPDAAAVAPTTPPTTLPTTVNSFNDVEALIAGGKVDAARAGLRKLLRKDPKNGFYHLRLGHLSFERGAWSSALASYKSAIKHRRKYRSYATVNRNAIRALGSNKTRWAAHSLLTRTIGRAAIPFLKRAASSDKSSLIRKRAAAALKKIR